MYTMVMIDTAKAFDSLDHSFFRKIWFLELTSLNDQELCVTNGGVTHFKLEIGEGQGLEVAAIGLLKGIKVVVCRIKFIDLTKPTIKNWTFLFLIIKILNWNRILKKL